MENFLTIVTSWRRGEAGEGGGGGGCACHFMSKVSEIVILVCRKIFSAFYLISNFVSPHLVHQ